ncbi:hypothetical protein D3C80_1775380 [compost metagenome]
MLCTPIHRNVVAHRNAIALGDVGSGNRLVAPADRSLLLQVPKPILDSARTQTGIDCKTSHRRERGSPILIAIVGQAQQDVAGMRFANLLLL